MKLIEIALTRKQLQLLAYLNGMTSSNDATKIFKYFDKSKESLPAFNNDKPLTKGEIARLLTDTWSIMKEICDKQPLDAIMVKRELFIEHILQEPIHAIDDIIQHIDFDGILNEYIGKEIPIVLIDGMFEGNHSDVIEVTDKFKLTEEV